MADTTNSGAVKALTERLGIPWSYIEDPVILPRKPLISSIELSLGIGVAGAAFGVVVWLISVGVMLTWGNLLNGAELPEVILLFAMTGVLSVVVGALWAFLLALLLSPVAYLFARSLGSRVELDRDGPLYGGFIGFVAVFPAMADASIDAFLRDPWPAIVSLALGPALATVFGQLGGAWGGRRAQRPRRVYLPAMSMPGEVELSKVKETEQSEAVADKIDDRPFQFGIRHLLWLSVWISALLGLIRLTGLPFELFLPLIAGWTVYQAITLRMGRSLFAQAKGTVGVS